MISNLSHLKQISDEYPQHLKYVRTEKGIVMGGQMESHQTLLGGDKAISAGFVHLFAGRLYVPRGERSQGLNLGPHEDDIKLLEDLFTGIKPEGKIKAGWSEH